MSLSNLPRTRRSPAWFRPVWGNASALSLVLLPWLPIAWVFTLYYLTGHATAGLPAADFHKGFWPKLAWIDRAAFAATVAGVVSLVMDGRWARSRREAKAAVDRREAAAKREGERTGARAALIEIYAVHYAALVGEITPLMAPDRYGRRDEAAIAAAFNAFQREVAEPALVRQAHDLEVVSEVFETTKAQLLGAVLRDC
jgi:hypothetical protein